MKKHKDMKTLKATLTICLMSLITLAANAADAHVNGISYNISSQEDKTVEVTFADNAYSGYVVIPSTISINGETYTVEGIEENAFSNCFSLTNVSVPATVKNISFHSFDNCASLKSISVDKKNKNFCCLKGVLYNKSMTTLVACPGAIEEINLPDSVKNISGYTIFGSTKGMKIIRK